MYAADCFPLSPSRFPGNTIVHIVPLSPRRQWLLAAGLSWVAFLACASIGIEGGKVHLSGCRVFSYLLGSGLGPAGSLQGPPFLRHLSFIAYFFELVQAKAVVSRGPGSGVCLRIGTSLVGSWDTSGTPLLGSVSLGGRGSPSGMQRYDVLNGPVRASGGLFDVAWLQRVRAK